jgi:hypothetical protein
VPLPLPLVAADSVRRLSVAIVLATNTFNRTLAPAEIERAHEEVAEFYAFYQQHGAGKVDFDLALVQIDRPLARNEIAEVSPGRYYLSRENLAAELEARGFRGRFDEVIALHAWSNANPDRALQAYGGGAVGPDGNFLGDAGFNSIPVMGRDPNTIGQVLIHEVLHNLDDMFSRSGMPDDFLNSDEMSRNMAQLLRERPGAFLPEYSDSAMLAYADRERQGREAYPWRLQLVYYAWMLERTPKAAWDRLRYGRMVPREGRGVRPLYSTVYTSTVNDAVYVPVLAPEGSLRGAALTARTYTQADFDGSPISSGRYLAGWFPLRAGGADTVLLDVGTRRAPVVVRVVRQRVAHVAAPADAVRYVDAPSAALAPEVRADRCCGEAPVLAGARVVEREGRDPATLPPGVHRLVFTSDVPGTWVHPARTRLEVRRRWSVAGDGPLTVAAGAPVTVNAFVREDRARDDVTVRGSLAGRPLALTRTGDGRYSVTVTDELPHGLQWARLEARAPDGAVVRESVHVYVRPAGWIQVPERYLREPDGRTQVRATMVGRMGTVLHEPFPLVAVADDRAVPLLFSPGSAAYQAAVPTARETERIVVTSLAGDPQRRVVRVEPGPRTFPPSTGAVPLVDRVSLPPYAAAVRVRSAPAVDGDDGDWPATEAPLVPLGRASFVLTDTALYRGDEDLSGSVRFAWDDSTLYVAGELTDDSVTAGEAWDTDRVNLVFDMQDNTTPVTYETANPTLDRWQDDDYWLFWRAGGTVVRRFGKVNADPVPGARLVTRRTRLGWTFEAAIPRAALPGYVPFPGQVAGLQVFVTDGDAERAATELMWTARWPYGADGIEWRLAELGVLLFVDAPRP